MTEPQPWRGKIARAELRRLDDPADRIGTYPATTTIGLADGWLCHAANALEPDGEGPDTAKACLALARRILTGARA